MSIKINKRNESGAGLVEQLMMMGVIGILALLVVTLFSSSTTQMTRMINYCDMNGASQLAMDTLSREIRRANRVVSCTTNVLQLQDEDGIAITYSHDRSAGTLMRTKSGVKTTLLRGCEGVTFTMGRRNPGAFENFPASSAAECKVVNVRWQCSRSVLGTKTTTENMATASVVIRRQGT